MPENTQTAGTANTPTGYGWCAWHQAYSRGVRLISAQDAGSGPGTQMSCFACHSCRQAYDLVPLADRP
ncbi:hypothetical protein OG303_36820 [Streptomyces sp. NBC_00005]